MNQRAPILQVEYNLKFYTKIVTNSDQQGVSSAFFNTSKYTSYKTNKRAHLHKMVQYNDLLPITDEGFNQMRRTDKTLSQVAKLVLCLAMEEQCLLCDMMAGASVRVDSNLFFIPLVCNGWPPSAMACYAYLNSPSCSLRGLFYVYGTHGFIFGLDFDFDQLPLVCCHWRMRLN